MRINAQRFLTGSRILLVSSLLGYGLAFLTSTLQARILGPEGRGILATAAAPAGLLISLLPFNIQDYFAREAAARGRTRELSRVALTLSIPLGVIAVAVFLLLATVWQPVGGDVWWILAMSGLAMPITIYGTSLLWVASGSARYGLVASARLLPSILALGGLAVAAVLHWGVLAIAGLLVASSVVASLLPLVSTKLRPTSGVWWEQGTPALRFGLRAWPAGVLMLVSQRIDLLVVAFIATRVDVGYYAIATNLAAVLTAISNAIAVPTRNLAARGESGQLAARTALATWLTTAGFVVMALLVPLYVHFLLGSGFDPLRWPAWILLAAEIPLAGTVVLNQILVGWGLPSKPLAGGALALVTTGLGAAILYPSAGLTGVAIACFAGNAINMVAQLHRVQVFVARAPLASYFKPPFFKTSGAGQ